MLHPVDYLDADLPSLPSGAQFRPLDADEITFLDSVSKERLETDRKRKAEDDEELESFHK